MSHDEFVKMIAALNEPRPYERGNYNFQKITKEEEKELELFINRQQSLTETYPSNEVSQVLHDECLLYHQYKQEKEKDEPEK